MGLGPPKSNEDEMYQAEVAQVVIDSKDNTLLEGMRDAALPGAIFTPDLKTRYRNILSEKSISQMLRKRLAAPIRP